MQSSPGDTHWDGHKIWGMYCDLHLHSTASDGSDRPEDLPALARQAGLGAIALTDHDTTAGLAACAAAAERQGLAFVPGIELSADLKKIRQDLEGSLHILGLFIDAQNRRLVQTVQELQENRRLRVQRIVDRLNELGVRVDFQEVLAVAGAGEPGQAAADSQAEAKDSAGDGSAPGPVPGWPVGVVGRPHVALVLVQKGYAKSIQDAFARYLARGAPAYVPKTQLAPRQAIRLIHEAGGLAILAHPVQLRCASQDEQEYVIKTLADMDLDGIETRHWEHTPADVERFESLARRLRLLTSGGSDYHGAHHAAVLGGQKVDMAVYARLRQAWETRRTERIRL